MNNNEIQTIVNNYKTMSKLLILLGVFIIGLSLGTILKNNWLFLLMSGATLVVFGIGVYFDNKSKKILDKYPEKIDN